MSWVQIQWLNLTSMTWPHRVSASSLVSSGSGPQQRGFNVTLTAAVTSLCLEPPLRVWGKLRDHPKVSANIQWFKWSLSLSSLRISLSKSVSPLPCLSYLCSSLTHPWSEVHDAQWSVRGGEEVFGGKGDVLAGFRPDWVHWCPRVALTNYHRPGDLKWQKCILS